MSTINTQASTPVKEIELSNDNSIAFAINDEPTKADYIFINNLLTAHLTDRETLQLLLQLENLIDIEINYLFNELKTVFDFYKKRTRVAVIAPKSMKKEIHIEQLVSDKIDLKYFPMSQREDAEKWLAN